MTFLGDPSLLSLSSSWEGRAKFLGEGAGNCPAAGGVARKGLKQEQRDTHSRRLALNRTVVDPHPRGGTL